MMDKKIGINQRIPLESLYIGLESFLNGNYSEEYILQQLRMDFKGENRIKKTLALINQIILRNPMEKIFIERGSEIKLAIKGQHDRNLILTGLLNGTISFSYDAMRILGKYLSIQEIVSKEVVLKSLSAIYGGNRSTDNAFDSVIPMFIQAGLIFRPGKALYQRNEYTPILSSVTREIFIESFKIHNGLEQLHEYHYQDPYFLFLRE